MVIWGVFVDWLGWIEKDSKLGKALFLPSAIFVLLVMGFMGIGMLLERWKVSSWWEQLGYGFFGVVILFIVGFNILDGIRKVREWWDDK